MWLKWLFDRTVSLFGLLVLWPILLIVAVLIKIYMPGPVLFKQTRVGQGGKLFTMVKFRSMTVNHGGSSVSVAGESRITPLGAKLRKFKLDELPELWNVLKGEMSFVGPRPDVPGYADVLTGEDCEILDLRPGITGPASLKYRDEEDVIAEFVQQHKNGGDDKDGIVYPDFSVMREEEIALWYNNNVIFPDKVRINRYYLHHYSFVDDIEIIIATVLDRHIVYNGETI